MAQVKYPRRGVRFPTPSLGRATYSSRYSTSEEGPFYDSPSSPRKDTDQDSSRNSSPNSSHTTLQQQGITTSTPKYMKELDKKYKAMNYFALADAIRSQLPADRHTHLLKTYQNTIVGSDIAKWLLLAGYASTAVEANYLATGLMSNGHIYNVIDEDVQEFQNSAHALYRFCADDRVVFLVDSVDLIQVEGLLHRSILKQSKVVIEGITYQNVLSGLDIVDVMIQNGLATERHDGRQIGQKMLVSGMIRPVPLNRSNHEAHFVDASTGMYCLQGKSMKSNSLRLSSVASDESASNTSTRSTSKAQSTYTDLGSEGGAESESFHGSMRHLLVALTPKKQQEGPWATNISQKMPSLTSSPASSTKSRIAGGISKKLSNHGDDVNVEVVNDEQEVSVIEEERVDHTCALGNKEAAISLGQSASFQRRDSSSATSKTEPFVSPPSGYRELLQNRSLRFGNKSIVARNTKIMSLPLHGWQRHGRVSVDGSAVGSIKGSSSESSRQHSARIQVDLDDLELCYAELMTQARSGTTLDPALNSAADPDADARDFKDDKDYKDNKVADVCCRTTAPRQHGLNMIS